MYKSKSDIGNGSVASSDSMSRENVSVNTKRPSVRQYLIVLGARKRDNTLRVCSNVVLV